MSVNFRLKTKLKKHDGLITSPIHNMIYCCLTTYNPDLVRLGECIESILNQVDKLIVVDNNSINKKEIDSICKKHSLEWIDLNTNLGIGAAQNIVWRKSINDGAEFMVFSDQDTIFPGNSIKKLISTFNGRPNCAVVAPVYRDKNSSRKTEVSVNIFETPSKLTLNELQRRTVSHVISSGMVVRNNVASIVGLNREDLFIDWVDSEWCWRVRLAGFDIIQVGAVVLEHVLGEDRISIGRKKLTRHKLFRSYYKIRNAIILIQEIKNNEIRFHLLGHTFKNIALTFISDGSFYAKLKLIRRSLMDAFSKKMGIYE